MPGRSGGTVIGTGSGSGTLTFFCSSEDGAALVVGVVAARFWPPPDPTWTPGTSPGSDPPSCWGSSPCRVAGSVA